MLLSKVKFFGEDFRFHYGDIRVEGNLFTAVTKREGEAPRGCDMLIPGMVDIHLHGNSGADFSDGDADGLGTIARYLALAGTTSFCAASMSLPEAKLEKAYQNAARFNKNAPDGCSALLGITMEGPFLSGEKKGAHEACYLYRPDAGMLLRLQQAAEGLIRIVCVAPELPGATEFIRAATDMGIVASAAHTNAGYDEAAAGFDAGITYLTHLYNAMPSLHHHEPGIIGAAAERPGVMAELIGDGIHVHPSAVRAAFRLFGAARICLISDAIPAAGLPDGRVSTLGGQRVVMVNGRATLENGVIAGSVTTLLDCVRRVISMGIPAEDALRCATANPAGVMGLSGIGVIAEGKRADFLVMNADGELKGIYMAGRCISSNLDI